MTKMTRHLAVIAGLVVALGMGACGAQTQSGTSPSATDDSSQSVTAEDNSEAIVIDEDTKAEDTEAGDITEAEPEALAVPEADDSEADASTDSTELEGTEYEIADLKGSVRIPDGYFAFDADNPPTDEMCSSMGVDPTTMESAMSLLGGQTLIVSSEVPYEESEHIYIKVKDKKYEDITLSELSQGEYDLLASNVVSSFGTSDYETVEGNGLRFFFFSYNRGLGNTYRYATILNGHMIYVYEETGDAEITAEQRAVLESIALSIKHGL